MSHWKDMGSGISPSELVRTTLDALLALDGGVPYLGIHDPIALHTELGVSHDLWTSQPFLEQVDDTRGELAWICTDGEAYIRWTVELGVYTPEEGEMMLALLTLALAGG